jgi:hypothetical protein
VSGHPQHGTKPLAASLRVAAEIPPTGERLEVQLYRLQFTEKVQGFGRACERAQEIKKLTGHLPTVGRV